MATPDQKCNHVVFDAAGDRVVGVFSSRERLEEDLKEKGYEQRGTEPYEWWSRALEEPWWSRAPEEPSTLIVTGFLDNILFLS